MSIYFDNFQKDDLPLDSTWEEKIITKGPNKVLMTLPKDATTYEPSVLEVYLKSLLRMIIADSTFTRMGIAQLSYLVPQLLPGCLPAYALAT